MISSMLYAYSYAIIKSCNDGLVYNSMWNVNSLVITLLELNILVYNSMQHA